MSVADYMAALLASPTLGAQVTCHRLLPAVPAVYAPTRLPWPAAIAKLLADSSMMRLARHDPADDNLLGQTLNDRLRHGTVAD